MEVGGGREATVEPGAYEKQRNNKQLIRIKALKNNRKIEKKSEIEINLLIK